MNLRSKTIILLIIQSLFMLISSMPDFGMNKPHLLFHLGDRRSISLNIGWGYWAADDTFRLNYRNTNDQLYAKMNAHDGESIFQQEITDSRTKLSTLINYQLINSSHWETQINMKNTGSFSKPMQSTWFTYFAVQNNDYRLVDHQKYSSHIILTPKYILNDDGEEDTVQIDVKTTISEGQKIRIKVPNGQNNELPTIFGLTANTSETYNIGNIASQFKHLVQIHRKQNITRSTDPKILSWENSQLSIMTDKNNFEDKKYIVVFVYGTMKKSANIFLTNSTSSEQFNSDAFKHKLEMLTNSFQKKADAKQHTQILEHVVSNLYGGITYYTGRLYTQNSLTIHSQDYCYSFTPSRLIFPRSFLWDDGFHQAVAINYNPNIVLDVIKTWMNKIDMFGWIGREQIRGYQISAMMPDSTFIFQDWFEMNPPTLMLTVLKLISVSQNNIEVSKQFQNILVTHFDKLQSWYRYFKTTQSHETLDYDETRNNSQIFYRWQCKDQCKNGNFMGSGLDDYPRRMNDAQISKQHVDVISWLYLFADVLKQSSEFMKIRKILPAHSNRRIQYYHKEAQNYKKKLFSQFLDPSDNLFKDIVVKNKEVYIESFVDKIGYINLFPFITGMLRPSTAIDQSKRITALTNTIKIMKDEKLLFSKDGLRSLSISDKLYGTQENYWRGAIWMPINYMVLRACKLYYWNDSKVRDQVQDLYKALRENLIETVSRNYKETGYLYENYYQGKGHRGFPFYGWTSLIANIITGEY